jgi:hypothetical protein
MSKTIYKFQTAEKLDRMLQNLNLFLREIPVYELENRPEPAAALLSHATMCPTEEETK